MTIYYVILKIIVILVSFNRVMSFYIIQITVPIFGGPADPTKPEVRKICSSGDERTSFLGSQKVISFSFYFEFHSLAIIHLYLLFY